jgi:hypothetical protein
MLGFSHQAINNRTNLPYPTSKYDRFGVRLVASEVGGFD